MIEPPPLLCLDFEASGNDPRCYPIEVAIANVAPGNARDWLIAPTPVWLETGLWQAEAEAIHGLSRAEIIAFGRSVADVARELAAYAQGAQVLSDAPTFDGKWLRDLYTAAGTEPPFVLLDFHQFIWREAAIRGRRPDIAIVKAEAEAYVLFPKQHRAGPDARRNAEMIRQVQGMTSNDLDAKIRAAQKRAQDAASNQPLILVRCRLCGWVHAGVCAPEPAGDRCFRCKATEFEIIDREEFRRTVPAGVTLQALRWPPINQ